MSWIRGKTCLFHALCSTAVLLAACGSDDAPSLAVRGTAVPVAEPRTAPTLPGKSVAPNLPTADAVPVARALPARFTEVAPAPDDDVAFVPSPAVEYDLGNVVIRSGESDQVLLAPVHGWIRYPLAGRPGAAGKVALPTGAYPLVVLLHGMHSSRSASYQGYDYLAKNLASHGYVVLSIDANVINADGDATSQSRAQLLLGTLDRLDALNRFGGPGMLDVLRGKLDFTRIGILGHSRGGQGVIHALKYNITRVGVDDRDLRRALLRHPKRFEQAYPDLAAAAGQAKAGNASAAEAPGIDETRYAAALNRYNIFFAAGPESIRPYIFKAAFLLAPTDFSGGLGLSNVPLGVLLPSCDGDMSDLEGAGTFDRNRFGFDTDGAPRHQVLVRGANHNFYNTVWTADGDDDPDRNADHFCAHRPADIRLDAEDQQRTGLFLINSFMRLYVGGEGQFAAYWQGHAKVPDAACPSGIGPCDARMVVSTQRDASHRAVIRHFADGGRGEPGQLGEPFALTGFDASARCDMPIGDANATACTPARLDGFQASLPSGKMAGRGLRSVADHLELAWSKPGAKLATQLHDVSARAYDSLTFRATVVRPMGQEIVVTLTDTAGHRASVAASDFSDALYLAPREKGEGRPLVDAIEDEPFSDGDAAALLDMVAIPLDAFGGVDTAHLASLDFMLPKAAGRLALTDIEFQTLRDR